jgi:hypothetical protein
MWIVVLIGVGIVTLTHTAPAPFVIAGDRAVWQMWRGVPPTVYLTYDDGPNPTATPDLLDVLRRLRHGDDIIFPIRSRFDSLGHDRGRVARCARGDGDLFQVSGRESAGCGAVPSCPRAACRIGSPARGSYRDEVAKQTFLPMG